MEYIKFRDQSTLKFKVIVSMAFIFLILAIVLKWQGASDQIFYAVAAFSVIFFGYLGYDGFIYSNLVTYDKQGATVKLVGRKTFGFTFNAVSNIEQSEKGLLFKISGDEVITLSRKRYSQKSLETFYTLLVTKKIASHE